MGTKRSRRDRLIMVSKKSTCARIIGIESHGLGERLLGVYIRLGKGSVAKTREVLPEVFANFDRHGAILGIEFASPGEYDIDAMAHVSEVVKVPQLRGIDVSRKPVDVDDAAALEMAETN